MQSDPNGPVPQHWPFTHMNVGGQRSPAGPQPVGGGTQVVLKQHCPFMHWSGGGQSAPMPQPPGWGTHLPMLQTLPGGQDAPSVQLWAVHIPPTQVEPGGQLSQAPWGTQAPFSQIDPGGQVPPFAQLCATQLPSTQVEPGGQDCPSGPQAPVTGWQLPSRQTVFVGQGGQPTLPPSGEVSEVRPQPTAKAPRAIKR